MARRPYALDRLGVGARDNGGRWNARGTAVIYTAGSIPVAALETFVHTSGIVPTDLVLVRVELPERHTKETPAASALPADWKSLPPGPGSMSFGTQWAQQNRSLVLYVPSVIIPEEFNGVLNPNHPEFSAVRMTVERDFHYDPRMFAPRSPAPPAS
jgi:RES domain-containing protein